MTGFERLTHGLGRRANWISAVAVVAIMLLVTLDVVLRLFRMPITGTYDMVEILASMVISFSLAYTSIEKGHIAVEFLVQRFGERTQRLVALVNDVVCTVFFLLVAWRCFMHGLDLLKSGEVSPTLQVPTYPFVFGVSVGCVLLSMVLSVEALKFFKRLKSE